MLNPGDVVAQMADSDEGAEDAERARLTLGIEGDMAGAGLSEEYVSVISRDGNDRADWRTLPLPGLRNLRITIAERARNKPLYRRSRKTWVTPHP